jgi:leucine-zipper-like transcriptional regulator 1
MAEAHNSSDMDIADGNQQGSFTSSRADWRSREMAIRPRGAAVAASPNPNDEDTVPSVVVDGRGPGRRAGHTATAVHRKIFVFGGSCGSDYLNDFYVLDTDPPPRARVTEPTSLHLVERRLRHFFNDEEFSDVTFLVQGQKVYGHKMVLSIVSECFRAMFTSGFRESESMEIPIPDCSYDAFLAVMEYIYTGTPPKSDARGGREADLSRLVEILELADRFFLDNLKQICETLLQTMLDLETVEYMLQVALKTNAMQLQAVCEHYSRNRDTM